MRHPVLTLCRAFLTVCACVFLLPTFAAAEASLAIDFDGDGQRDQFRLDRREPSVLHIWLSASDTSHVIRTRLPLLQVVAKDLDGDHRPELIARDTDSQIHVWTRKHKSFHSYRPRDVDPGALRQPNDRTIEDSDSERPGVITNAPFAPFALTLCAATRTPGLESATACAPHTTRAFRSSPAAAPFAPRPPPARILL